MRATERMWSRWKAFAHRLASVQARVLLALLYFTLLVPFALILRLTSRPFRMPGWQQHQRSGEPEPEAARRQF